VLGNGRPAVSPHEQPVPIASVAKVMTAYVVLKHYPLRAGASGPRFVVGRDDVVDTEARRREGQSVVDVRAGEQLAERDALMAVLLPSANNVAVLVARQVSGSVASFVAQTTRTYWLPVAGEVTNTNTLLGQDGFVGMKTGSDGPAGG
jgi:D-alanyl-D-alanine carboxypeptidase (penicillin-binding protein 5/6)